ncbi:MAG TPA: YciI family protein [Gemmataceae bacterium]|nr:YciI family protein [Gemmataceae bacterium]
MAFVLLIVEKREDRLNRPKDVGRDAYAQMVRFAESLQARGVLRAVESLKADVDAVRIETRGGKRSMMDGPFAESKEFVGGFFLIDCPTKQEAIAIANECPAAAWATVEVRETGPCHGD